jgi:hypothetical protein
MEKRERGAIILVCPNTTPDYILFYNFLQMRNRQISFQFYIDTSLDAPVLIKMTI